MIDFINFCRYAPPVNLEAMNSTGLASTQEPAIESLLFLLIIGGSICCVFLPFSFKSKFERLLMWAPGMVWILYAVYETLMPVEMDIRLDLAIIYPLLLLMTIAFLARLSWFYFKHQLT